MAGVLFQGQMPENARVNWVQPRTEWTAAGYISKMMPRGAIAESKGHW